MIVQLLEANKAKQAAPKTGPKPIGEVVKSVTASVTPAVTDVTPKRDTVTAKPAPPGKSEVKFDGKVYSL